jgi:uncharacterized protein (DUF2141 family)
MRKKNILLLLWGAVLLPLTLAQSAGGSVQVNVAWKGTGTLVVKIFDKSQFDTSLTDESTGPAVQAVTLAGDKSGKGSVTLTGIPPGTYAVSVYLDANGDGKLNRGPFGPAEPWGMSRLKNPPKDRAPRFNEASFTLADGDSVTFDIAVR